VSRALKTRTAVDFKQECQINVKYVWLKSYQKDQEEKIQ
jgi:hypothetical protein